MATFTIRTNTGFNMADAFALSNPNTTLKNTTAWIVKDTVTGEHQNWYGTGFTYDANNRITGGTATKMVFYDALNVVQTLVQFPTAWNFATKGIPNSYTALLSGNDRLVGGAGNDVLLGFGGDDTLGGGGINANGVYPHNGHSYVLSNASTWTNAQAQAESLGGNLVTINNQAENDWLVNTFGTNYFWIGYTDQETEGVFKWISGETSTYTNWANSEPNNGLGGNEDYAHIYYSSFWNDLPNSLAGWTPMQGLIELNTINNGNDTLKGGQGNDTYLIDSTGDTVIEYANQGTDTVQSSLAFYRLTANVENLTLTIGTQTGVGNALNNVITGNSSANTLIGYGGNDTLNSGPSDDSLSGGLGNDTLQGGAGIDTAFYSGSDYSGYRLNYLNGSLQVTDTNSANGGNTGTDTLTGIEELQFSGKTIYTNAVDIFKAQLVTPEEKQVVDGENAGMVRVMADFSKAAYALQSWERDTTTFTGFNAAFNDKSDNADTAYQDVRSQGWQPLNLGTQVKGAFTCIDHSNDVITHKTDANNITTTSTAHHDTSITFDTMNGMDGGYYTEKNAAAFVARCGDSIVLSFRGTNDNRDGTADSGVINRNETNNGIHPDVDQWGSAGDGSSQSMANHYALFTPLINRLNDYVTNADNGINHVYVTGHSLGGAMAIKYMATHPVVAGSNVQYEAITFAAPAFTSSNLWRESFKDDHRITQVEITADPVPQTWDAATDHNRPGDVIRFAGNNTLQTPDGHISYGIGFNANDNNHSMDYYRTIANNVDAATWQTLLQQTHNQTLHNQDVFLGGNRAVANRIETFTVANGADTLAPTDKVYNVIYGGQGNDSLTGVGANELLIGGRGQDDLTGGLGADTFRFYSAIESGLTATARDVIHDFNHAQNDTINLLGIDADTDIAGNNAFTFINSNAFSQAGQLRFASGILAANTDADLQAEFQIALTGLSSLAATDFVL